MMLHERCESKEFLNKLKVKIYYIFENFYKSHAQIIYHTVSGSFS